MNHSSAILPSTENHSRIAGPLTVLIVGVVAAFGVGKLPPVLPSIQQELTMSLVQASYLIGFIQLAGAVAGLLAGSMADRFGPRRMMQIGLLGLASASLMGAYASGATSLLLSRAVESAGFVLAVLPAPVLLRNMVAPEHLSRWLGVWATFMPVGFAIGLLSAPWLAQDYGWRGVWQLHSAMIVIVLLCLRQVVARERTVDKKQARFLPVVVQTVRSSGPWILAASFCFYAGQYLSIMSFLPTVYQQAGISTTQAGALTALAAASNLFGNVSAGYFAHRGVPASRVVTVVSVITIVGAWLVFASDLSFSARYVVVVTMSLVMGAVPGTLFICAARYAPTPDTVSTTVGLMQQGSAIGQLLMPSLVALIAFRSAGWHNTWIVIASAGAILILLAQLIKNKDRRLAAALALRQAQRAK